MFEVRYPNGDVMQGKAHIRLWPGSKHVGPYQVFLPGTSWNRLRNPQRYTYHRGHHSDARFWTIAEAVRWLQRLPNTLRRGAGGRIIYDYPTDC